MDYPVTHHSHFQRQKEKIYIGSPLSDVEAIAEYLDSHGARKRERFVIMILFLKSILSFPFCNERIEIDVENSYELASFQDPLHRSLQPNSIKLAKRSGISFQ